MVCLLSLMMAELTAEMVVEYLLPLHSALNFATAQSGLPSSLPGEGWGYSLG